MASNKREKKKSDSASSTGPLQQSQKLCPHDRAVLGDPTELTFQVSVLEVMSFNNQLFPLGKTDKDSSS